jgi:hypothetical protein
MAIPFRYATENKASQQVASPMSLTPRGRATAREVRYRRPTDRRSRTQRWYDTVAGLAALRAEYVAWHNALPESLRGSATADALQAIVDLDLHALIAIVPSRGYGGD